MRNLVFSFIVVFGVICWSTISFAQQLGSNTVLIPEGVTPHYLTDDSISLSGNVPVINPGQVVYILYGYCNSPVIYKATTINRNGDTTILGVTYPTQGEFLKAIDEVTHNPVSQAAWQKYKEQVDSGQFPATFSPGTPGATMTDSNGKALPTPDAECNAAGQRALSKVPTVPVVYPLPPGVTFNNLTDTSVTLSGSTPFAQQVISSLKPDWTISIPKSGGYCNGNRILAKITSVNPNASGGNLNISPLTPPYTCAGH